MNINHDYSYIKESDRMLMNRGYGQLSVHSVRFDRYYTEEEKANNVKLAGTMTREEWCSHCNKVAKSFAGPMEEILKALTSVYDIHQTSEETNTLTHYKSDWDLYFWSDRGWNGNDFMTHFRVSFNKRRSSEQNMNLLKEIIALVEKMEYANIGCWIQYDVDIDLKRVNEEALAICEKLEGKFVTYHGNTGKIKAVKVNDRVTEYRFFKKNAKSRYYPISGSEILNMHISQTA